ncbi:hypothetical protein KY318_00950 [Candidatus Woesearchaeota archaeon]|nr:hypothetical protein [Candidatus Woesearchaeota archaeon]
MKLINYKVEHGKLLRISVEFQGDRITQIRITGDFFVHPEESLFEIERLLIGKRVNEIKPVLRYFVRTKGVQLVGFSVEDLVEALNLAMVDKETQA